MILDIRYHIASLVAVFLALGLGILIGASLLDEGRLVESQEKLIVGLEKRFDTLQAERSLFRNRECSTPWQAAGTGESLCSSGVAPGGGSTDRSFSDQ